jgi:hypothetical protein
MWPVLIRPPLDMLWIKVSSRSRISVFWFLGEGSTRLRLRYDGCRLGINGRGGAGVLGYLVRAPTGDVGDLSCAEMSGVAPSPCAALGADGWLFRCLRCRRASSLWSLIRIDRLAGAISSAPDDLDRECRLDCTLDLPDADALPTSDSDSDDIPDEKDPEERVRRPPGVSSYPAWRMSAIAAAFSPIAASG